MVLPGKLSPLPAETASRVLEGKPFDHQEEETAVPEEEPLLSVGAEVLLLHQKVDDQVLFVLELVVDRQPLGEVVGGLKLDLQLFEAELVRLLHEVQPLHEEEDLLEGVLPQEEGRSGGELELFEDIFLRYQLKFEVFTAHRKKFTLPGRKDQGSPLTEEGESGKRESLSRDAPVAQLDRASDFESKGWVFKSPRARSSHHP